MYWLGLHRNSKAKSHGSWCWHAEEAFPLASSLISTTFCRGRAGSKVVGVPLAPGQHLHTEPWARGNGPQKAC